MDGQHANHETIRKLAATAATLDALARDVAASCRSIEESLERPATLAATDRETFAREAEALGRFAQLFVAAARRYGAAADRLEAGDPQDAVLEEVIAYSAFLGDQIASEHADAARLLARLQGGVHHENC